MNKITEEKMNRVIGLMNCINHHAKQITKLVNTLESIAINDSEFREMSKNHKFQQAMGDVLCKQRFI